MPIETSPEAPLPLSVVNRKMAEWINRLSTVWVEAQITQVNHRGGSSQVFLQARDVSETASITVVMAPSVLATVSPLSEGARVVMSVKPEFWSNRGQLVLRARAIQLVGIGDLLARIEALKKALAAEGLFAAGRKQPLPFLPRTVGLICGRASAAEKDVVENARRRWPGVAFEIREVAVQGPAAVTAVVEALAEIESIDTVDVIIITRGGGSVEDLLPFSDERLIRAVSDCAIPVVSAIGHEQDTPLLDFVADVRASTPTDAARRVVPDLAEERALIVELRSRSDRLIDVRLEGEQLALGRTRSHLALADPQRGIDEQSRVVGDHKRRTSRALVAILQRASDSVHHLSSRLTSASPAGTMARGYAIVQTTHGQVVRSGAAVAVGDDLTIHVADGLLHAEVTSVTKPAPADPTTSHVPSGRH